VTPPVTVSSPATTEEKEKEPAVRITNANFVIFFHFFSFVIFKTIIDRNLV